MKSNKDRYREHNSKQKPSGGNGGKGGMGLAILMTAIIMIVIIALKMLGNGMAGNDDLTIGEGKPIPDATEIFKHLR